MIKQLTAEQLAEENRICDFWIKEAFRTTPITQEEASVAVENLYAMLGEKAPPFKIARGPLEAWKMVCETATDDPKKRVELEKTVVLPLIDGVINAGYYAYLDFLDYIGVGVGKIEEVQRYRKLAKVSWFWPMENLAVLCDHPLQLHVDNDGNLSNEEGPSVEYGDGLKLWDIRGIQVDEQIVLRPETQNVKQIFADTNADRQAIRLERFGWLRVLKETNARILDEGPNDTEGTYECLYDAQIGERRQKIFVATCVTGKIPVMPVPDDVNTREEAQVWLKGDAAINVIGRT